MTDAAAGISSGALGTAPAQQHARNIVSHFDVRVPPQPKMCLARRGGLLDERGRIGGAGARAFLTGILDRLAAHMRRFET